MKDAEAYIKAVEAIDSLRKAVYEAERERDDLKAQLAKAIERGCELTNKATHNGNEAIRVLQEQLMEANAGRDEAERRLSILLFEVRPFSLGCKDLESAVKMLVGFYLQWHTGGKPREIEQRPLPCPFCGAAPNVLPDIGGDHVICATSGCPASRESVWVNHWNRRAPAKGAT